MSAPVPMPPLPPFALARAALRADRFRAAGVTLALAALALVLWGAWAGRARLALREPRLAPRGVETGASAPASPAVSPAALTLRAAGLARRRH